MSNKITYYLVGVYGTLKRGFGNHKHYIADYDGEFQGYGSLKGVMIDLVGFPGVIPNEKAEPVQVEVYKVSASSLRAMDSLENNGQFYTRHLYPMQISINPISSDRSGNLPMENVWVYTLPDYYLKGSYMAVTNGFWEGPNTGGRLKIRNKAGDIRNAGASDEIPMNANDKKITAETSVFSDAGYVPIPPIIPAKKEEEVWIFPQTISFEKYMEEHGGINHAKTA